jgi:hypothetical protein
MAALPQRLPPLSFNLFDIDEPESYYEMGARLWNTSSLRNPKTTFEKVASGTLAVVIALISSTFVHYVFKQFLFPYILNSTISIQIKVVSFPFIVVFTCCSPAILSLAASCFIFNNLQIILISALASLIFEATYLLDSFSKMFTTLMLSNKA